MADPEIPTDPIEVYKRIIDDCVERAKDVGANRIRSGNSFVPQDPAAPENVLIQSLAADQRETLARMLDGARVGGMHDLLSDLTWWIEAQGLRLTYRGQSVPVDFSGMGLHGDLIGRLMQEDRWEWPEKAPSPLAPWRPRE
jgi:hypothetical protein